MMFQFVCGLFNSVELKEFGRRVHVDDRCILNLELGTDSFSRIGATTATIIQSTSSCRSL